MAQSAPKAGSSWTPLVFLGGLGIVGFGMFQLITKLTEGDFMATGQLVAKGTEHGDITLVGGTCLVGERFDYEGVYVRNQSSGGVRVIQGSTPSVRIEIPGSCAEDDREKCRYLDVPRVS